MRLKEIKEGMVIRCANTEERRMLWEELCRIGNMRTDNRSDSLENFVNATSNVKICDLRSNTWAFCGYRDNAINFSDLIIKDELTNEEVIELFFETYFDDDIQDEVFGSILYLSKIAGRFTPQEIVEKLTEYKKSKEIKVVSKEEYSKVASDKLDELYPKGWKLVG